MRIEVVGAGSLGLLLASRLANVGYNVTLVCRTREKSEQVMHSGITVSGLTRLYAKVAAAAFEDTPESVADWLLITVKQPDLTPHFREGLVRRLGTGSRLLLFQNGLGHVDKLADLVAGDRLYVAVTTEGARRLSTSAVAHTGRGETWFGLAKPGDPGIAQVDAAPVEMALTEAGFCASLSSDMESRIWDKLMMNAVINPLTAVLRVRNGELLASPGRVQLMKRLFEEAAEFARALGRSPAADAWERLLAVCRATAANESSMLQDLLAGKPTELEAITGWLVRLAKQSGRSLPTHEVLYELVRCLDVAPADGVRFDG